jgi:serine/threonine protein kinase
MAPELVLNQAHDSKIDIWSVGILAHFLLVGDIPFCGETVEEVYQAIAKGEWDMSDPAWDEVSEEAKDFVKTLLKYDPAKRPSAEKAYKHPWLNSSDTNWCYGCKNPDH